jgi:hypothetical protein
VGGRLVGRRDGGSPRGDLLTLLKPPRHFPRTSCTGRGCALLPLFTREDARQGGRRRRRGRVRQAHRRAARVRPRREECVKGDATLHTRFSGEWSRCPAAFPYLCVVNHRITWPARRPRTLLTQHHLTQTLAPLAPLPSRAVVASVAPPPIDMSLHTDNRKRLAEAMRGPDSPARSVVLLQGGESDMRHETGEQLAESATPTPPTTRAQNHASSPPTRRPQLRPAPSLVFPPWAPRSPAPRRPREALPPGELLPLGLRRARA